MTGRVLLGVDTGTTGLKVVAAGLDGRLLRDATVRYPTRIDGPAAEQDPEDWWRALRQAAPEVVAGAEVAALAVTCQAPTLVAVDRDGHPLTAALTWLDRRASLEAAEIAELAGSSRNGADPYFGTAKIAWLGRHHPRVLERAAAILGANGYLVHRLTGQATLDESTAALTQAWDDTSNTHDVRLQAAGIRTDLLPRAVPCTSLAGEVTAAAAEATGIPAGTPVAAGAIDAVGAALEAGALTPGDPPVDMTGFSTVGIVPVPRGTTVPGLIHSRHGIPGVDLVMTAQVTTGSVLDWLGRLLGGGPGAPDDAALLALPRPGRLLMVPSLQGERTPTWDAGARGVLLGLDLTVTGQELVLAAMEGTAMALGADVARLRAAGLAAGRVRATGGGARGSAWPQIKADVLGVEVEVPAAGHGAAQGAAYLAGLATGHLDADDLRGFAAAVDRRFAPDPARHAAYSRRLPAFEGLRDRTADLQRTVTETVGKPGRDGG